MFKCINQNFFRFKQEICLYVSNMIKSYSVALFVPLMLLQHCVCAQTDSITKSLKLTSNFQDSLPKSIIWSTPPERRVFPYKSFLVPAVMVAYGYTATHNNKLNKWNLKAKQEIYTERQPSKTSIDNYLVFAPAVAVYGLNAMGIKGKNNFRDRTILFSMSQLITSAIVFPVKSLSAETRPDGSNNFSFPSGHTATAFANAEFMRQEYKDVSPWYGVAGYAVAATTGYLRMYNNKHWLGDVVAGAGIGIMSTKLAYWIYPTIKKKIFKDKDVHTVVMPTYQSGSFGLGMVHQF